MSKKSKKSNRGKNELDSILAQLKQSYANDAADTDLDTIDTDTDLEDDSELSSILEKIFSDTSSNSDGDNKNTFNDSLAADQDMDDDEDFGSLNESIADTVVNDKFQKNITSEASNTDNDVTQSQEEATKEVDDVLQLMFSHKPNDADESSSINTDRLETVKEDQAISVIVDESIELENNESDDSFEYHVEHLDAFEAETDIENTNQIILEESDSDSYDELDQTDITDIDGYDVTEDISNEEDALITTSDSAEDYDPEFAVEDEEYDSQSIEESVNDAYTYESTEDLPRLVLSPMDYTNDPLQDRLPTLETSVAHQSEPIVTQSNTSEELIESSTSDENQDLNNNDISLLLRFGYNEEVISKIGEENVQKVLSETDAEFKPEFYNTPYGYCGKEFSSRQQVNEINAKYRYDKLILLIKMIFIAVTSLSVLAADIYFEFFADRSAFPIFIMFEFFGVALIGILLWKKLVYGAIGIAKFESNVYSTLVLIFCSYILYDIAALILYAINYGSVNYKDLMLFGASAVLYALFASISELLSCIREANTFSLIASTDRFFTAERHVDVSVNNRGAYVADDNKAYKIRKTALISGYFKKTAEGTERGMNLIYLIGVIPIMSLIIGCSGAIISNNVFFGLSSMMMTTVLCTPIAFICIPAISEFVLSNKLRKRKTGFVGNMSSSDYTKTTALYFTDTDAIDIISCTEIQPGKSKGAKESLSIAHSVFRSLGGPLGYATSAFRLDESDERKEVVINSIAENGIDLYFDSSLNILIGDKQYMQSHNLKVKTDTSLHTATKGLDRSVIYMAFDGVPKLGFIVTSRIKADFAETVALLAQNDIRVFIDSYEPQINDVYFEQNKVGGAHQVTICKSSEHDYVSFRTVCNGNIVCASDSTTVAKSILESKNIADVYEHNQRSNILLSIIGLIISVGITALLCIGRSFPALENASIYVPMIMNLLILCGLIPGITGVIKLWKTDSLISEKQGKTQ